MCDEIGARPNPQLGFGLDQKQCKPSDHQELLSMII